MAAQSPERRQVVRFAFYKLDNAWRRLSAERQAASKIEFAEAIERFHGRLLLRPYGLDDQEFVVAFEGDNPADFLDLVMELRESKASSYTLRDTPTLTCVQMSLWDLLDTLGGVGSVQAVSRRPARADGYTPVATLAELPPGASKRVYAAGEAVALFNVNGSVYAIANRCTHARASLSEGAVDLARCAVTCPWHEGVFSLETGQVLGGPPAVPVPIYRVKLEEDAILIAPAEAREPTVAPPR